MATEGLAGLDKQMERIMLCVACKNTATCHGPMGSMCDSHCGHAGDGEESCTLLNEDPQWTLSDLDKSLVITWCGICF